MNSIETPKTTDKQLKFYWREARADSFQYVGSMTAKQYDVDYEGHARRAFGLENCEVLCVMGEYAYTFQLGPSIKA